MAGLLVAPPVLPQEKTVPQFFWSGTSGGFAICWTSADIQARPEKNPTQLAFSVTRLARRGFQAFISPPNLYDTIKNINYERKFALLSVAGSIVSLKDELYYEIIPSAHPGGETRFTAIDLTKRGEAVYVSPPEADLFELDLARLGKVAKLTDYFPEPEVFKALLNHHIIQKALAGESPPSLTELLALLNSKHIDNIPYLIPRDLLTRFAFHHLQGNKVAVRLGLPSASGAARYLHAELELMLPIPPALKKPLTLAASGKEGFLMADRQKIAGDALTRLTFSFEPQSKVK
ncbi:MAG TPA: hypothetical protein VE082_01435 [Desulfobaccales bacterium]|nr:hypothetical protein [Desulfobaccales bacterium]